MTTTEGAGETPPRQPARGQRSIDPAEKPGWLTRLFAPAPRGYFEPRFVVFMPQTRFDAGCKISMAGTAPAGGSHHQSKTFEFLLDDLERASGTLDASDGVDRSLRRNTVTTSNEKDLQEFGGLATV
jgi:hypothetical protein